MKINVLSLILFIVSLHFLLSCTPKDEKTYTLDEGVYELALHFTPGKHVYHEKYLYKLRWDEEKIFLEDSELITSNSVDHPTIDPPMVALQKGQLVYLIRQDTKLLWEKKNNQDFPESLYFPLSIASNKKAYSEFEPKSSYWELLGEKRHFSKLSISLLDARNFEGYLALGSKQGNKWVSETELKQWSKDNLSGFKEVVFVFDCCRAGSMIAATGKSSGNNA